MGNLEGKRVLLTGGGQGIGQAIARELLQKGAQLALSYRSSRTGADAILEFARQNGRQARAFQADLTDEAQISRLVDDAARELGGLDCLVNNAGDLVGRRLLAEVDQDFYGKVLDVNLKSMLFVTRAALPFLQKAPAGASIVNLASLAGRKGGHGGSLVYSAAKGAILTATRALAAELGPYGIRVNAVAPGLILGTSFHATHTTSESAAATLAGIPLARAGSPEDVARAVSFLAAEYDGFISGATLDVNGGAYCA